MEEYLSGKLLQVSLIEFYPPCMEIYFDFLRFIPISYSADYRCPGFYLTAM